MTTCTRPEHWAGNLTFAPSSIVAPGVVAEPCEAIRGAGGTRVKALGAGHSFEAIAATGGLPVAAPGGADQPRRGHPPLASPARRARRRTPPNARSRGVFDDSALRAVLGAAP